jgi:hypothetical protein
MNQGAAVEERRVVLAPQYRANLLLWLKIAALVSFFAITTPGGIRW